MNVFVCVCVRDVCAMAIAKFCERAKWNSDWQRREKGMRKAQEMIRLEYLAFSVHRFKFAFRVLCVESSTEIYIHAQQHRKTSFEEERDIFSFVSVLDQNQMNK